MSRAAAVLAFAGGLAFVAIAHADVPARAPAKDSVFMFEVDVDSLPRGDAPAMLVEANRPKPMPEGITKGQGISITKSGTSFEIVPDATTPASVQTMRPTSVPQLKTTVACDPKETRAPWPLRWESIGLESDGTAAWNLRDGWMDVRACKISVQRESTISAKAVAFLDGAPFVFAVRDGDGVTFLVPPADSAASDASLGAVKWQRGSVSRVRLPISRGGSAVAALSLDGSRAAAWIAQMSGKKAPAEIFGHPMMIRIEASQAVGEEKPTIIVRLVSPAKV